MNRAAKILLLLALGSLFSITCYAKELPQKTDKIKIFSACCINDRWIFRVFDGLTGETITITQNKKNGKGFAITAYNQKAQTAELSTPKRQLYNNLRRTNPVFGNSNLTNRIRTIPRATKNLRYNCNNPT